MNSTAVESDQENSLDNCQLEHRFAQVRSNCRNSPSLPPCKGRRKMREHATTHKPSTDSTSGFSSLGSLTTEMSESNSDIFYIYKPIISMDSLKQSSEGQQARDRYKKSRFRSAAQLQLGHPQSGPNEEEPVTTTSHFSSSMDSVSYVKHSNLDVRELTFAERVHLARLHYLTIRNGIRLALVLFCLGWFIYNAYTILKEYTEYGTVVYMEYRQPKFTGPPAISICTHCILCSYNSNVLQKMNVIDIVAHNESENAMYSSGSSVEDSIGEMNSITISCSYKETTVQALTEKFPVLKCHDVVPVVVSMQEGRKCFTLFSDIQGQMSRLNASNNSKYEMEYERFPMIHLVVSGNLLTNPPAELLLDDSSSSSGVDTISKESKANSGLFIALHDPAQLSYMHDIPMHRIQPGKSIDVRFEKKIEVLKEPPYSTNCFHYPSLLEDKPVQSDSTSIFGRYTTTRSGLAIYRSRGECLLHCTWRTLNTGRCVNIYSIFLDDLVEPAELYWQRILGEGRVSQLNWNVLNENGKIRFCARTNRSLSEYLYYKQKCLEQCNQACRVESFSMSSNILDTEGQNENVTTIDIQWAPEPFIYISHKEKLDLNEFLGALGGHAHIWLGLSVIHVIRYLIHLVKTGEFLPETSCCCIIFWWKSFVRSRHN